MHHERRKATGLDDAGRSFERRREISRRGRERATLAFPEASFATVLARLWQEAANSPIVREGLPTPLAIIGNAAARSVRLEGAA